MKLLVALSTIDLKYRLGCTPAWWQLLKAAHEGGHEVILIPYLGRPVESLWWRTYENPCTLESIAFNRYLEKRAQNSKSRNGKSPLSPVFNLLINNYIKPKWERHLLKILAKEKHVDAVLVMNIPVNHISGIPSRIKQTMGIPVIYYDGDMPTILPKYATERGFKFNYYEDTDLSEYDAFLTNSKGCMADLEEIGAKNVHPLYYGIDPGLCRPVKVEEQIDVSFFGYGSDFREEWMGKMITIPSQEMPGTNFAVAGGNFKIDLGNARIIGDLSYSEWRDFCCGSKINLNITRWSHTNIYASSTARPFELAAFGACTVSQPYKGIEEWFEVGKEIIVVNSEEEAVEVYKWLLSKPGERRKVGKKARERVLKEHTFRHRAEELIRIIDDVKG
jgi:hypothetical protein